MRREDVGLWEKETPKKSPKVAEVADGRNWLDGTDVNLVLEVAAGCRQPERLRGRP